METTRRNFLKGLCALVGASVLTPAVIPSILFANDKKEKLGYKGPTFYENEKLFRENDIYPLEKEAEAVYNALKTKQLPQRMYFKEKGIGVEATAEYSSSLLRILTVGKEDMEFEDSTSDGILDIDRNDVGEIYRSREYGKKQIYHNNFRVEELLNGDRGATKVFLNYTPS